MPQLRHGLGKKFWACYNSEMIIVDGKRLAAHAIWRLAKRPRPRGTLAAVLVGNDPASISFLKQKQAVAARLKIKFVIVRYPASISQHRLEAAVANLSRRHDVSGILVQLPLPRRIRTQAVLDRIPAAKDVDVLSSTAFGKFVMGNNAPLPPIAGAIAAIVRTYRVPVKGARAVVIGSGKLVGLPAAIWLAKEGATVYLLNEWTKGLRRFTKDADIVVCGTGKPDLVRGTMLKKGAVVFDAGYAMRHGKPAGDCEFTSVAKKARLVTPVPGGIGPLTVAMLFKNFYDLA